MGDYALEAVHARPLGRVALLVTIIALAHPQEVGREPLNASFGACLGRDRPDVLVARPHRRADLVAVADVGREIVLLDHIAHVIADLRRHGDRRPDPGLEAIAEGVEIAVGADARKPVAEPCAAKRILRLEDHIAAVRALGLQVIGAADARDSAPRRSARRSAGCPSRRGRRRASLTRASMVSPRELYLFVVGAHYSRVLSPMARHIVGGDSARRCPSSRRSPP